MTNKYTKKKIDIDMMIELYESGMTQNEVAKALGTTQKVIHSRMKEIGYKARTAAKRDQKGEKNSSWKGGRSKHSDGYWYVKCKGHPRALNCGDYVLEHILIVEKMIGRYLKEGEVIHHIDENKENNEPSNLYLTNPSEHTRIHNLKLKVKSNLQKEIEKLG